MGVTVRAAVGRDLAFATQDGLVESTVVRRKIEQNEVFVAELDRELVGYLRLEYLWSVQPYLSLVHVLESHRRRGVGRALLAHVEHVLRDAGQSALFSSSQVDEPDPQSWHRHMGFVECGIITGLNDGGVGEVFFRKLL